MKINDVRAVIGNGVEVANSPSHFILIFGDNQRTIPKEQATDQLIRKTAEEMWAAYETWLFFVPDLAGF